MQRTANTISEKPNARSAFRAAPITFERAGTSPHNSRPTIQSSHMPEACITTRISSRTAIHLRTIVTQASTQKRDEKHIGLPSIALDDALYRRDVIVLAARRPEIR
jgi:hypothetical protein